VRFDAGKSLRGGIALLALAAGCGGPSSGLTINVVAGSDVVRPDALSVSWISDRGTIYERDRIPVASDGPLASIFIELDRSDSSDRRVLIRGVGPGAASSIGAIRIREAVANQTLLVTLRAMMPDADGDGIPDVIDDCRPCPTGDAGTPDDAFIAPYDDASPEPEPEPDASAPADAGTPDPDAELPSDGAPADAAAPPPIAGLMGMWRMDDGTGTVVRDSSPTGNAGTIMRPTASDWGPGRPGYVGTALNLTGTNWLSVPNSRAYDADAGLTLSAWVFWAKATPAGQVIMARQRGVGLQNAFWLGLEGNRLHFSIEDQGVNVPMPAGRWVHVVGTYDGNKVTLYLDGMLLSTAIITSRVTSANRGVSVGADINGPDPASATSMFVGRIDDAAIFDRALTAAQIATLAK